MSGRYTQREKEWRSFNPAAQCPLPNLFLEGSTLSGYFPCYMCRKQIIDIRFANITNPAANSSSVLRSLSSRHCHHHPSLLLSLCPHLLPSFSLLVLCTKHFSCSPVLFFHSHVLWLFSHSTSSLPLDFDLASFHPDLIFFSPHLPKLNSFKEEIMTLRLC